jgi:hypothetical protein
LPLESKQRAFDWLGFLRLASQAIGLVAVFFALGLGSVRWWGSGPLSVVPAMATAAMICLFAAIAGVMPLWMAEGLDAAKTMRAWLIGTSLRTLLTVSISVVVLVFGLVPVEQKFVFGSWTIGFYFILLIWETAVAVGQVKKKL